MIEDRIREALEAEASKVVPHDHARADNRRRVIRSHRRRRYGFPALSVVAAGMAVSAGVLLVQLPGDMGPDFAGAGAGARLPGNLDPSHRPTGPVLDAGDGISTWLSGNQLCWRLPEGSGNCSSWRFHPGALIALSGTRERPLERNPTVAYTTYGVADKRVTAVRLQTPTMTVPGQILRRDGMPYAIWQVTYPERATLAVPPEPGKQPVERLRTLYVGMAPGIVFTGADGKTIASLPFTPLRVIFARPLTKGVPLFTYRERNGANTIVQVYRDGTTLGVTTTEDHGPSGATRPARPGIGSSFGSIFTAGQAGPEAPWSFGFASARMTRVVAELYDGQKLEAKITTIHGRRVFYLQLTGVEPGRKINTIGQLVGYDANGQRLATQKI